jgi:FkbM family methyltransferase
MKGLLYSQSFRLLKRIVAEVIINSATGTFIRLLSGGKIKRDGLFLHTSSSEVSSKTVASFFFNSYESSERRFIKKYLRKDLPVIEIGSSIGIVSSQIGKSTVQPMYCIEANPHLIPIIKSNLTINGVKNYKLFNCAVGDSQVDYMHFEKGSTNIHGQVFATPTQTSIPVPVTSLSQFKEEQNIGNYILVSDIEGAEIYLLKNDLVALDKCEQVIIETHDTNYMGDFYKYQQMKDIFLSNGFVLVDSYGPNYVFSKS